jgi:hypothetical protein
MVNHVYICHKKGLFLFILVSKRAPFSCGHAFRRSRPALDSFVEFRGREPSPDALLRSYGVAA